jgi:hypothetical protein
VIVGHHKFVLTGALFNNSEVFGLGESVDVHGRGIWEGVLVWHFNDGVVDQIDDFDVAGSGVVDNDLILAEHSELIHGIGIVSFPNLLAFMVDVHQLLSLFSSTPNGDVYIATIAAGELQNFSRGLLQFDSDCVLQQIHSQSKISYFYCKNKMTYN